MYYYYFIINIIDFLRLKYWLLLRITSELVRIRKDVLPKNSLVRKYMKFINFATRGLL